jgi:hypothetical protein
MARLPAGRAQLDEILDHAEIGRRLSDLLSRMLGCEVIGEEYREPPGDEGHVLRIDAAGYHWNYLERGSERTVFATRDTFALLYRIVADQAFWAGVSHELENRIEGQDSRRLMFAHQRELLARLGPDWTDRLDQEIADLLREHPFND